jgi:hypothetical protein
MATKEPLSPMQQELLNRADEIFKAASNAVATAAEFGKEQLPDIAYQYITFSRAYISLTSFIAFACMLVGLWLLVNVAIRDTRKLGLDYWESWVFARYAAAIAGTAITIIAATLFFVQLKSLLLVWFAPKIFLIQGMVDLIKN